MSFTLFLLYFITFFISCLSCLPSSTDAILPSHAGLLKNPLETLDSPCCNFTLIAPKKVINPYKSKMKNFVPQKPFGSFLQKCTACMAVAYQLIKTINATVEQYEAEQKCQEFVNEKIAQKITELCAKGFKKLREMCSLYIAHMDLEHISNNYGQDPEELNKHLCWGTGIFRDCLNLDVNLSLDLLKELGDCNTCGDCCTK